MQMIRKPLVPEDVDRQTVEHQQRRALHRALAATALAQLRQKSVDAVLRRHWPNDETAALIVRAAASPLGRDNFLQATVVSLDVLALVAPESGASKLFSRCLRLDLGSVHAISVPNAADVPLPAFVAERAAIPAAMASFASNAVGPSK